MAQQRFRQLMHHATWTLLAAPLALGLAGCGGADRTPVVEKAGTAAAAVSVNTVLAGGYLDSAAIAPGGTVFMVGYDLDGELGNGTMTGTDTPVQVGAGLAGVTSISSTWCHTLALTSDGTVWAWGNNSYGQLGNGTSIPNTWCYATQGYAEGEGNATPAQVALPDPNPVIAIATGEYHSLAVTSDNNVWAWGYNAYGQLGDGTTMERLTPVQVTVEGGSPLTGVVAVAAGSWHSLALKSDGTVWTWGYNLQGQLGIGSADKSAHTAAVQVTTLSGMTALAAGEWHSVALKSDGTVWAWGYNAFGRLGDGTTIERTSPVQTVGISGVTAIAANYRTSLALTSAGTVWGWGYDGDGELGNGVATTQELTPVQASGLAGVVAIAAGGWHSLAVDENGVVWGWGLNNCGGLGGNGCGELADGTTVSPRLTPESTMLP
jgi:alpha-tubulin suppressor-like RCC1 family protein